MLYLHHLQHSALQDVIVQDGMGRDMIKEKRKRRDLMCSHRREHGKEMYSTRTEARNTSRIAYNARTVNRSRTQKCRGNEDRVERVHMQYTSPMAA
jgi:hypothetical protein